MKPSRDLWRAPPPAPRLLVQWSVTSRELPVSVPAEIERERTVGRGRRTAQTECSRDWIHRMQKSTDRERRNGPLLPPRRTSERDRRGEKYQYNLSSDQYSRCLRRCIIFSIHTILIRLRSALELFLALDIFCFYCRLINPGYILTAKFSYPRSVRVFHAFAFFIMNSILPQMV